MVSAGLGELDRKEEWAESKNRWDAREAGLKSTNSNNILLPNPLLFVVRLPTGSPILVCGDYLITGGLLLINLSSVNNIFKIKIDPANMNREARQSSSGSRAFSSDECGLGESESSNLRGESSDAEQKRPQSSKDKAMPSASSDSS